MMRKFISFFLIAMLFVGFASCDSDNNNDDEDDTEDIFVWDGDWNDPDDPKYKPEYGGKYNPIVGVWRRTDDKSYGYKYTEKFEIYLVWFSNNSSNNYTLELLSENYKINSTAYSNNSLYTRYKIENNKLYAHTYKLNEIINNEWVVFEKIEE